MFSFLLSTVLLYVYASLSLSLSLHTYYCRYKELVPGRADGKSPSLTDKCKCHYAGSLIDGTEFDSSYKRGEPLALAPNQVIKGWTEAMQLMKEGAKWELYVIYCCFINHFFFANIRKSMFVVVELDCVE